MRQFHLATQALSLCKCTVARGKCLVASSDECIEFILGERDGFHYMVRLRALHLVHPVCKYFLSECGRMADRSMPASSQCNCSTLSVTTASSVGHLNRSSSNRLIISQKHVRSHSSILMRSRRRLLNTNRDGANGSSPSACSTSNASPLIALRPSTGSRCK